MGGSLFGHSCLLQASISAEGGACLRVVTQRRSLSWPRARNDGWGCRRRGCRGVPGLRRRVPEHGRDVDPRLGARAAAPRHAVVVGRRHAASADQPARGRGRAGAVGVRDGAARGRLSRGRRARRRRVRGRACAVRRRGGRARGAARVHARHAALLRRARLSRRDLRRAGDLGDRARGGAAAARGAGARAAGDRRAGTAGGVAALRRVLGVRAAGGPARRAARRRRAGAVGGDRPRGDRRPVLQLHDDDRGDRAQRAADRPERRAHRGVPDHRADRAAGRLRGRGARAGGRVAARPLRAPVRRTGRRAPSPRSSP